MKEDSKKRVHFFLPPHIHKDMKRKAVEKEISITQLMTNALLEYLVKENNDKNMSSLQDKV